ncbi:MAG: AAA family ATPase [Terriglobales bacterium]
MSRMTAKDPVKAPARENLPPSDPLLMVSICLDKETWGILKLFSDSAPLVELDRHLGEYRVDDHESVLDWIGSPAPDVCLLDFDHDRRSAAMVAERIHAEAPETAIFAVSSQSQSDLIIQAMRSGCTEYLVKPLDTEQLLNAVARVGGRRREKKEQAKAQVLAFVGAKGGCGVTTIVTQLGALLAQTYSRRVLILDLHHDFGDAALYLGLTKYRYHSYELVENTDRLDAELLQSFVLRHSSGLDLIPAPQGIEPAHPITPGALAQTLEFLRLRYEFILVDLPPGLNEEHLELIRSCDQVNIVAIAEVSALRNVVRQTDYFTRKEIAADRIRVILNRHQGRSIITEAQIEKVIGQKIFWKVPNHYVQMLKSISGGDPLGQSGNSEVARNLNEWAGLIGKKPNGAEDKKGRSFLGIWSR